MSDKPRFRAGDEVKHIPSGETWEVGASTDSHIYPNGWPPGRADVADCELVRACTEQRHEEVVRAWVERDGGDERTIHNRDEAVLLGIAEWTQIPCCSCGGTGKQRAFKMLEGRP